MNIADLPAQGDMLLPPVMDNEAQTLAMLFRRAPSSP